MSDNRNHKETIKEKLERLGACGMGYPDLGLPCIRPKDHNPFHDCFALMEESDDGRIIGCYMQQDGKDWVTDRSQFPTDLVISTPLYSEKMEEAVPDRRGLVEHTRSRS